MGNKNWLTTTKTDLGFVQIERGERQNRRRGEPEPVSEMVVKAKQETEERARRRRRQPEREPDLGVQLPKAWESKAQADWQ